MRNGGVAVTPSPIIPTPGGESRRAFFRLDLTAVTARFEVERVGDEPPEEGVDGKLADVSGGGARLVGAGGAAPAWPLSAGVHGVLHFGLPTADGGFALPCRVVRRVETAAGFELAFQWQEAPPSEIDRLIHALYQLELRERALGGDEARSGQRRPGRGGGQAPRPSRRSPQLLGAALGLAAGAAVVLTPGVAHPGAVLIAGAAAAAAGYLLRG
jgi:hypothetical protein